MPVRIRSQHSISFFWGDQSRQLPFGQKHTIKPNVQMKPPHSALEFNFLWKSNWPVTATFWDYQITRYNMLMQLQLKLWSVHISQEEVACTRLQSVNAPRRPDLALHLIAPDTRQSPPDTKTPDTTIRLSCSLFPAAPCLRNDTQRILYCWQVYRKVLK